MSHSFETWASDPANRRVWMQSVVSKHEKGEEWQFNTKGDFRGFHTGVYKNPLQHLPSIFFTISASLSRSLSLSLSLAFIHTSFQPLDTRWHSWHFQHDLTLHRPLRLHPTRPHTRSKKYSPTVSSPAFSTPTAQTLSTLTLSVRTSTTGVILIPSSALKTKFLVNIGQ